MTPADRLRCVERMREADAARPFVERALDEERESTIRRIEGMETTDPDALRDCQRYLKALKRIRFRMVQEVQAGEAAMKERDDDRGVDTGN